MKKNISVVLIAHNEENNVGKMIQGLMDSYTGQILETVVVDDNSTDRTPFVVSELQEKYKNLKLVRRNPPCGVGRALKTGFQSVSSKADYILSMDSDFIKNISQVNLLITEVEKGYDGIIGSRFIKGGRLVGYPLPKRIMNRFFHLVIRIMFNIKCKDLSNNFKLYKRNLFQELPYRSNDFAMNAETGILPIFFGYKIKEVPVFWIERDSNMGKSKFTMLKNCLSYIVIILNLVRKRYTNPPTN